MSVTVSAVTGDPNEAVAALPAISLSDLNSAAALQTRTDRKYILGVAQLSNLVSTLGSRLAALDVDGQRSFNYESVYFDTPQLTSFHSAAYKRRKRFKVRTRSYLDSHMTMVEVKTKTGRGVTVKQRQPHSFLLRRQLNAEAQQFVDSVLDHQGLTSVLQPVLTTTYGRMTLVDLSDVARLTIDSDLRCTSATGRVATLEAHFIVETKSGGTPSVADRQLWANGIRPVKISKFGTGMAALDPSLPSNKWNRTLNRYFRGHPSVSRLSR